MLPHRFPRPLRLSLYALATAILLLVCNLPQKDLPHEPAGDKVEHTIAWFLLTSLGYALAPRRTWAIPAYAAVIGVLVEVLQGVLPFGRDPEVADWFADMTGVVAAVLVFAVIRRVAKGGGDG
jgi:VanZ family protein